MALEATQWSSNLQWSPVLMDIYVCRGAICENRNLYEMLFVKVDYRWHKLKYNKARGNNNTSF